MTARAILGAFLRSGRFVALTHESAAISRRSHAFWPFRAPANGRRAEAPVPLVAAQPDPRSEFPALSTPKDREQKIWVGRPPLQRLARPDADGLAAAAAENSPSWWSWSSAATATGMNCTPESSQHSCDCLVDRLGAAVGPADRHHVPRVGEREQRRPLRDLVGGEPVRVALAVGALVVGADPLDLLGREHVLDDPRRELGVLGDLGELERRSAARSCGAPCRAPRSCRRRGRAPPRRAAAPGPAPSRPRGRACGRARRRARSARSSQGPWRRSPGRARAGRAAPGSARAARPAPGRRARRRSTGHRSSTGRGRAPCSSTARRRRSGSARPGRSVEVVSQIPAETVSRYGAGAARWITRRARSTATSACSRDGLREDPGELVAADAGRACPRSGRASSRQRATRSSIASPASWPPLSLICLKWSTSITATDSERRRGGSPGPPRR